jgi:hypothetical protein
MNNVSASITESTTENTKIATLETASIPSAEDSLSGTPCFNFYNHNFQEFQDLEFQIPYEPDFWDASAFSPSSDLVNASATTDLSAPDTLPAVINWFQDPLLSENEDPWSV